jgi:hypothetical protein
MKKNPVRLSKIPAGKTTLADRGFANCTMYYPNLNAQITPNFLAGREQFSAEEVSSDRVKCQLRYTSETVFSRVTDITALHDRVSRGHFSNLHHIVDWAQGHANLCQPLQRPGRDNYFSNVTENDKALHPFLNDLIHLIYRNI